MKNIEVDERVRPLRRSHELMKAIEFVSVAASIEALADSDPYTRQDACLVLRDETHNPSVVSALIGATEDESSWIVRGAACKALRGANEDQGALSALIRASNDPHWLVKVEVCQALANFSGQSAVDTLVALTRDGDRSVRREACKALGGFVKSQMTLEALKRASQDDLCEEVREAAQEAQEAQEA